eukprot:TRINITY_DN20106_c0_g1_i1.p3 TRINITY_DN20106_c0_g1~~TRINITY_DN20106_c0_g1_i1.p3  ORF type:complete len:106 (-),score=57.65 TRINITY_DN20106_c0_g1_i1:10-285(-)
MCIRDSIYLFPEEGHGMQYNITLDIETACFHKQQKLDFNKWIYQGVPYLNERAEKTLMARLNDIKNNEKDCLLYTSPSPRDLSTSRMPSSA